MAARVLPMETAREMLCHEQQEHRDDLWRRRLCVDFDHVVHLPTKERGSPTGTLVLGAADSLRKLTQAGFLIVILTSRQNLEEVAAWIELALPFLDCWVTNVKLPALTYVDDRAFRFTGPESWQDILHYYV